MNQKAELKMGNVDDELAMLREKAECLRYQLKLKNEEVSYLHQVMRDRESSLSWKIAQFYGKFFRVNSPVTKTISFAFKKFIPKPKVTNGGKESNASDGTGFASETDESVYFGEVHGRVSVILPVYNQADLLEESIESVLNQTYQDFELIIVNDGSTDNIKPVLDKYTGHPRVFIVTQRNQKLPKALNNGFAYATGEFYTWTSADNIMLPQQLEKQVAYLKQNPHAYMVYCDYEAIDDRGNPLVNSNFRVHNQRPAGSSYIHLPRSTDQLNTVLDNFIGACFMYRGIVGHTIGDYDHDGFGVEDYDYWMRINALFNIRHIGTDDILYKYRVHDNTLNARASELGIYDKAYKLMGYDSQRRQLYSEKFDVFLNCGLALNERLAGLFEKGGHTVVSAGDFDEFRRARKNRKAMLISTEKSAESLFKHGVPDQDVYRVLLVTRPADEIESSDNVFGYADLILTSDRHCFDVLFNRYGKKLLCMPGIGPGNMALIEKRANNLIFFKSTRNSSPATPPDVYVNRKLNVMIETMTLDKGGLEQVVYDLARGIDRDVFNVYVSCIAKDGKIAEKCKADAIQVFFIDSDRKKYESLIRELKIDLINAHYSIFGVDIAAELGIPFTQVIHNNYVWLPEDDAARYRQADRITSRYIAVSEKVSTYARHYLGTSPVKTEIIPNGIDVAAFNHLLKCTTLKSRQELRIDNHDFIFLHVASYETIKGHNLIIAAMTELVISYPDIKVYCVGAGLNQEYQEKMAGLIKAGGLEKNVVFTGFLPTQDLLSLYSTADCFMLPSLAEGFSLATLEAALFGLPMILTDVGGINEIKDYCATLVIPNAYGSLTGLNDKNLYHYINEERPANTDELKKAMLEMYHNRVAWKARAEAGRNAVEVHFGIEGVIRKYEKLFKQTIYRRS